MLRFLSHYHQHHIISHRLLFETGLERVLIRNWSPYRFYILTTKTHHWADRVTFGKWRCANPSYADLEWLWCQWLRSISSNGALDQMVRSHSLDTSNSMQALHFSGRGVLLAPIMHSATRAYIKDSYYLLLTMTMAQADSQGLCILRSTIIGADFEGLVNSVAGQMDWDCRLYHVGAHSFASLYNLPSIPEGQKM